MNTSENIIQYIVLAFDSAQLRSSHSTKKGRYWGSATIQSELNAKYRTDEWNRNE